MIMVGAMIVASIETVWAGQVAPIKREIRSLYYPDKRPPIMLNKGEEMGRFKLGSTVIMLFGANVMQWQENLAAGSPTRMGEQFGTVVL